MALGGKLHNSPGMLGKKHSEETKKKIKEANKKWNNGHRRSGWHHIFSSKINMGCHMWKGDDVKYRALHYWVYRILGKPKKCEFCNKEKTTTKSIHWANKSGEYKRDLTDWMQLCAKCHKAYDSHKVIS